MPTSTLSSVYEMLHRGYTGRYLNFRLVSLLDPREPLMKVVAVNLIPGLGLSLVVS